VFSPGWWNLVDTLDSGSSARKGMEVQVLFRAM
jgi:hypothetical protein